MPAVVDPAATTLPSVSAAHSWEKGKRFPRLRIWIFLSFLVRSRFACTFFGSGLFAAICLLICRSIFWPTQFVNRWSTPRPRSWSGDLCFRCASFLLMYLLWPRAESALQSLEPDADQRDWQNLLKVSVYRSSRSSRSHFGIADAAATRSDVNLPTYACARAER